jgi:hypothetical protein
VLFERQIGCDVGTGSSASGDSKRDAKQAGHESHRRPRRGGVGGAPAGALIVDCPDGRGKSSFAAPHQPS